MNCVNFLLYQRKLFLVSHGGRDRKEICSRSWKPVNASSIPGGGGLLWLVLGKDYLLTFPNRSARCLYTVTGRDRVGFSDGEEPPPITCVAARKIVKSPGTEAESPIVPVIPYAMLMWSRHCSLQLVYITISMNFRRYFKPEINLCFILLTRENGVPFPCGCKWKAIEAYLR